MIRGAPIRDNSTVGRGARAALSLGFKRAFHLPVTGPTLPFIFDREA
jgi:hypothetical protein